VSGAAAAQTWRRHLPAQLQVGGGQYSRPAVCLQGLGGTGITPFCQGCICRLI
jgi:hypothetical protein